MCQTTIPAGETACSCTTCGSDLSRWTSKQPAPPLVQPVGHIPQAIAGETTEANLGMGIVGAILGACIGSGLMYEFYKAFGFRFPLLGMGIGFLAGLLAKKIAKGSDDRLGLAAGALSVVAVVGTLYWTYGTFPALSIISVILSASIAYRMASH